MKTRFEITHEIFSINNSLEECFKYYEKYFKGDGFILDKDNLEVYIIFDKQFNFNEGDRIGLFGITRIVSWKKTYITHRMIEYCLKEE